MAWGQGEYRKDMATVVTILVVTVIVALLGILFLRSRSMTGPSNVGDSMMNLSPEEQLLDRIAESPESYLGQSVTVEGEVEDVFSDRAFLVDAPGLLNDTLLVVTRSPFDQEAMERQDMEIDGKVVMTGAISQFALVGAEADLNVDLDPQRVGAYEGRPYLIADNLRFSN